MQSTNSKLEGVLGLVGHLPTKTYIYNLFELIRTAILVHLI